MPKYEYKTVSKNLTTTELCEYGEEGWQLISVIQSDDWYNVRHYFMRPIDPWLTLKEREFRKVPD